MANLPWRVSVRLMALAKKVAMVIGIIVVVLLAVRVYLSQQGPALHLWHTWRADEMSVSELADKVGITLANMSILKTGKAKAIKVDTLTKLCRALDCQPGDLLEFKKGD